MAKNDTSDWKANLKTQSASVTNTSSALFSRSPSKPFEHVQHHNVVQDAAGNVSRAIQKNFDLCQKLNPMFKTADGEVTVEDGVLGAMGQQAALALGLKQEAPTVTSSPGLGMPGHTGGNEPD